MELKDIYHEMLFALWCWKIPKKNLFKGKNLILVLLFERERERNQQEGRVGKILLIILFSLLLLFRNRWSLLLCFLFLQILIFLLWLRLPDHHHLQLLLEGEGGMKWKKRKRGGMRRGLRDRQQLVKQEEREILIILRFVWLEREEGLFVWRVSRRILNWRIPFFF